MQNTTAKLLFLLIVTGALFVGCAKEDETAPTADAGGSLEESVIGELGENEDDEVDEGTEEAEVPSSTNPNSTPVEASSTQTETSVYKDGTYSSEGAYQSPAGAETLGVTLVIQNDLVSGVSISNKATNEASIQFQNLFAESVSAVVVGKPLASLGALGAVNGASLTPLGFTNAVAAIQTLAKN